MTTLTTTHTHTPHMESVSTTYGMGVDVEYTFCETCEQNIDRVYFYDDNNRLPFYTEWSLTK
jgi:hypothetical protein